MRKAYFYDLWSLILCTAAITLWATNLALKTMDFIDGRLPQFGFITWAVLSTGIIVLDSMIIRGAYSRIKKALSAVK